MVVGRGRAPARSAPYGAPCADLKKLHLPRWGSAVGRVGANARDEVIPTRPEALGHAVDLFCEEPREATDTGGAVSSEVFLVDRGTIFGASWRPPG